MSTSINETSKDLLTTFSNLWDNNPKLIQILNQIDFSSIKKIDPKKEFVKIDKPRNDAYFSELFAGLKPHQLEQVFYQAAHWMNKQEIQFILDSWHRKESRFAQIKRERDLAIGLSQANANAHRAQQLNRINPTIALRMAEKNYQLFPTSKAAASSFVSIISETEQIKYRLDIPSDTREEIFAIAISPCGKNMLTGDSEGWVYRWDMEGKQLDRFQPHEDYINSLSFLPDTELTAQRILTGSKDGTAKILKLDGEEISSEIHHEKPIYKAVFSPQKDKIVTASLDGIVKVWDIAGNSLQKTFKAHKKAIYDLAIAPSGKYILTGSRDRRAKLWDLDKPEKPIQIFKGHQYEVSAVAFSNEKERPNILTGSWDTTAKLWNWEGQLIQTFSGHKDDIRAVAFSPDNQYVLTAAKEGVARLWEITGKLIGNLKGHTKEIHEIAFNPVETSVVTGSGDGTAKIWELEQLIEYSFKPDKKEVFIRSTSAKKMEFLAPVSDSLPKLWSLNGAIRKVNWKKPKTFPILFSFSLKKAGFLIPKEERNRTMEEVLINLYKKKSNRSDISAIAISPTRKNAIIGFWDESMELWDLKSQSTAIFPQKITDTSKKHRKKIFSAAFSADGQMIITGSQDESAKLWDLAGHLLATFPHEASFFNRIGSPVVDSYQQPTSFKINWVTAVAFLPTKNSKESKIATGSRDGVARLWDLDGQVLQTFEGHLDEILTLTFSPDGQYLLTGAKDSTVKLWDLKGNELQYYEAYKHQVIGLSFLPDNQGFLTYYKDRIVKHLTPAIYLKNKVALCEDGMLKQNGMEMPD